MSQPRPLIGNRLDALQARIFRHPLAFALAATFLFRLYGLYIVKILNNDTLFYLDLTQRLSEKGLVQGIREIASRAYTPLYPLMIHALDFLFEDTLRAAVAVSFIFGTLCVIPYFVTARQLLDERKALLASLLFAADTYFVRYSIYVLRDMVALFFFFSSAAFLTRPKPVRPLSRVLFGISAFLAISIRPEYLLIYVISGSVYLLVRRRWRALILIDLSISLFTLLVSLLKNNPDVRLFRLVLLERVAAGLWGLGNHLQELSLAGTLGAFGGLFVRSLYEFLGLMTPMAALLCLLGAFQAAAGWRSDPGPNRLLIITIVCTTIIYAVWGAVGGYFTRRFLILPGSLLFMFCGTGVEVIRGRSIRRPERAATIALLLVFSTMILYTLFHEVGGRREGLKHAGLHISRTWQGQGRPEIFSDERILSLYAGGVHVPYEQRAPGQDLSQFLHAQGIDYLILKEPKGQGPDGEFRALLDRGDIALDATLPYGKRDGKERQIGVYRVCKGSR